ncbi:MAG: PaaI family thioesterase, partial [Bacteroidales bacterium]|nr:PaaI family thioesterase [Bacteroidales bacterium]
MSGRVKIRNPFDAEAYKCFGCSPSNPVGLKLTFEEEDGKMYASWDPSPHFQGYVNVLHGGIIATLLDEVGAWCIYVTAGTSGVTSSLTVRYLKPVYISKGTVRVEAELV